MLEKDKNNAENILLRVADESLLSSMVVSYHWLMWKLENLNLFDRVNKTQNEMVAKQERIREECQKLLESRHSVEEVADMLAEQSRRVSRRMDTLIGAIDKNNDGISLEVKKSLMRCVKGLRERFAKYFEDDESCYVRDGKRLREGS